MATTVFGTGPVIRPILDTTGLQGPVALCVPEGDGGDGHACGPWNESFRLYGPAWLRRVVVAIHPVFEQGRPLSQLDAAGQALHCVWMFACQRDLKMCISQQGIGRVPDWSHAAGGTWTDKRPVPIESNGGSYRIPRGVQLYFGGGELGTPWDVDVIELLDYNLGHPDCFALDTLAADGAAVIVPEHHVLVQPLAGSLRVGGVVATTPGSLSMISLAQPLIVAAGPTLYRTKVAL